MGGWVGEWVGGWVGEGGREHIHAMRIHIHNHIHAHTHSQMHIHTRMHACMHPCICPSPCTPCAHYPFHTVPANTIASCATSRHLPGHIPADRLVAASYTTPTLLEAKAAYGTRERVGRTRAPAARRPTSLSPPQPPQTTDGGTRRPGYHGRCSTVLRPQCPSDEPSRPRKCRPLEGRTG